MQYIVNPEVFAKHPGFMRAVVIASGLDNSANHPELTKTLRQCEKEVCENLGDDFKEDPKLAVWAEAFRGMGINPNKYPPKVICCSLLPKAMKITPLLASRMYLSAPRRVK